MSTLIALLEPLRYGFMIEAVLFGSFVAAVCAVLSCFIVLKGWALVGDAVAHAVLPGIILAWLAGVPLALGAVASGVACVASAGLIDANTRVKPDAILGIVFTGFLAVGLILLAAVPSDVHFMHVILGNLLGVERADMIQAVIVGTATLIGVAVMRKDLILVCFDPGHADAIGLSRRRLELTLLVLVATATVTALQAVGLVLAVAMLITPGCIGFLLTERFDRMMLVAVTAAIASTVIGTLASFHIDAASGPAVVVAQGCLFIAAFCLAPRKGLLAARHLRLVA